jgi:outer membrane protein assembly factor BamB
MLSRLSFTILFFAIIPFAYSQYAQFRGPHRTGVYPDANLLTQWPNEGPELILSTEGIGNGWSSVVATHDLIYTTGRIDTLDYLTAIDYKGDRKWQIPYGRSWIKTFPDTRGTPTIDENRIYVTSGTGQLSCFDAISGEKIWRVDVDKEFDCNWHRWGVSESPLIVDDKVISTPTGDKTTVVAFNKLTGELLWQSESVGNQRIYASPILYEYNNFRYILAMTSHHLIAVNPDDGTIAWKYDVFKEEWNKRGATNQTNTPIFKDDEIYITKGYNYPSVMLKMAPDGKSVTEKWVDRTLDCHHHGVVLVDGHIYGANYLSNSKGRWVCMVWDTGEIKYVTDWNGKGPIIAAGDMLYCYEEKRGNFGLVKANPKEFEVVSSFKIDKGKGQHWAHPFIFNGKLFIRHGDVLMVYNIKKTVKGAVKDS